MAKSKNRKPPKRRRNYKALAEKYRLQTFEQKKPLGSLFPSTTYETTLGPLTINKDLVAFSGITDYILLDHLDSIATDTKDHLSSVVHFEKLRVQYPHEPYVHCITAQHYKKLKRVDKNEALIEANYQKFAGYPIIDLAYAIHQYDKDGTVVHSIFDGTRSLHDLYPSYPAFTKEFVLDYYESLFIIAWDQNDIKTIRRCEEIVTLFDPKRGSLFKTRADYREFPKEKRKMQLTIVVVLLVLVAIIGGIIWLLMRLFNWIF